MNKPISKIAKIKILLLSLSVVGLFFYPVLNSISLVLLSILTVYFIEWRTFLSVLKNNFKYYLPTLGIFILFLSGLTYTTNFLSGITVIEHSLSLAFIPLIVIALYIELKQPYQLLKIINVVFVLCTIILGVINYIPDYIYQVEIIEIHRAYAAMFFCYALIATYSFKIKYRYKYIFHVFFTFCVIATTAKAPILIFIITSVLLVYKNNGGVRALIMSIGIISLFITAISFHPETRSRFEKLISSSDFIRKRNWSNSTRAINDNLIIGVGTGSGLSKLQEYRNKEWLEYYENYNTHSQYLEIILSHGLIGLLLFLGCFFIPIRLALKVKNIPYLLFITMVLIEFLIEVYLARQRGVAFYSLFISLLAPFTPLSKSTELN